MARERPSPTQAQFWRKYDAMEMRLTAPVSERMLELAGLVPGMRVLDLATGRGEPALRAAHRVGPQGHVLGVDLSESLLEMARERAAVEGLSNVEFRAGNAELEEFPASTFQAVTVRWGLMSMARPVTVLTHARRALAAEGALVAAVWAEPERVPYYTLPRRLLQRYRTLPPLDPESPGTFRYADLERIHRDFKAAGLAIGRIEEMEVPVVEANTSEELVDWVRGLGLDALLNDVSPADEQAWESELKETLERLRSADGIRLGGVTRLVVARPNSHHG